VRVVGICWIFKLANLCLWGWLESVNFWGCNDLLFCVCVKCVSELGMCEFWASKSVCVYNLLLLLLLWGVCPLFLGYFTDTGFCCWKKLGLELGLAFVGVFYFSLSLSLSLAKKKGCKEFAQVILLWQLPQVKGRRRGRGASWSFGSNTAICVAYREWVRREDRERERERGSTHPLRLRYEPPPPTKPRTIWEPWETLQ